MLFVLSGNSFLFQFLKLPILIDHFNEHHKLDPNVDALDFLSMHYYGEDLNDQDEDRDMQMPLKKFDDLPVPFIFHFFRQFHIGVHHHEVSGSYLGYEEPYFSSPDCGSLFKPPRA